MDIVSDDQEEAGKHFTGDYPGKFFCLCFRRPAADRLFYSFQGDIITRLVGQNESPDRSSRSCKS